MIKTPEIALGEVLSKRNMTLSIAESCTGGLISSRVTDVAGSSAYFVCGIVAYSNKAKLNQLGVKEETIIRHGAVSPETAREMAEGIRRATGSTLSAAVTGIAGPGGGTPDKPVGLVYIAVAGLDGVEARRFMFHGDRTEIKRQTAETALNWLLEEAERR